MPSRGHESAEPFATTAAATATAAAAAATATATAAAAAVAVVAAAAAAAAGTERAEYTEAVADLVTEGVEKPPDVPGVSKGLPIQPSQSATSSISSYNIHNPRSCPLSIPMVVFEPMQPDAMQCNSRKLNCTATRTSATFNGRLLCFALLCFAFAFAFSFAFSFAFAFALASAFPFLFFSSYSTRRPTLTLF
jgi:hypothetical protein